jgi:microcystin-dependent protein
LGTIYGGDGQTTFALPDLRGRVATHFNSGHPQGQRAGEERHTLTTAELPSHAHPTQCSSAAGTSKSPAGNFPAGESNGAIAVYATTSNASLNGAAVTNAGGGQSHENMQPYLTLTFAIALQGIFPSRN